ncbi:MAG TPA: PQQ-dependent sugar dehydrogenase, partial [Acidimicrobiia bacterium]|nr:PQQ-dependent sugar dehydrogenase [Acidimicrobiia bacterium]
MGQQTGILLVALVLLGQPATAAAAQTVQGEGLSFDGEGGEAVASVSIEAVGTPSGFTVTPVFTGLTFPTGIRFAPDGRIFIAEKGGAIKVFNGIGDTTADLLVDLAPATYSFWDRGLLGLAVHPSFPTTPYVYALYTHDTVPYSDACPTPPGATNDGCMANGRLSRFEVSPANTLVGGEQIMLAGNWCQQYPSHSLGHLAFGPDGALYVSAGDGASFNFADYGQGGGDPGSP